MMNKDNRNDKIRKIAKKGLTFSLCAVLAGGLAAGSFEGVNKLAGWSGATTVEAASNKDETTLTYAKSEKKDADTSDSKSDTGKDTGSTAKGNLDVSEIASEALPSIVSITTKSVQEVQNYFGMYGMYGYAPQQQEQEVEGSGSGIIVGKNDDELLIATNYHVVEGADTLSVAFTDGNAVEASVKGFDEERDLAVVSVSLDDVKDDTMDAISIAKIGSSDDLNQLVLLNKHLIQKITAPKTSFYTDAWEVLMLGKNVYFYKSFHTGSHYACCFIPADNIIQPLKNIIKEKDGFISLTSQNGTVLTNKELLKQHHIEFSRKSNSDSYESEMFYVTINTK